LESEVWTAKLFPLVSVLAIKTDARGEMIDVPAAGDGSPRCPVEPTSQ